ncbi:hypothetical protein WA026_008849 [Henosepilachna vigintioctopunctata]|uniref:Large ribosomal subunit protein eL33 n=1 Tax=Henosepilachna vigintioctopunctata TaxID=420089 RepID=A0AAW1V8W8_9CUCU
MAKPPETSKAPKTEKVKKDKDTSAVKKPAVKNRRKIEGTSVKQDSWFYSGDKCVYVLGKVCLFEQETKLVFLENPVRAICGKVTRPYGTSGVDLPVKAMAHRIRSTMYLSAI